MTTEQLTEEQQQAQNAEDERAFNDGFGAEAAPQPEITPPVEKPQPEPQPEPKPEPKKDPWDGVQPVVREQFEGLSRRIDQLLHHVKSAEGRVGALQSAFAAAKADAKQQGADAPTPQQVTAAQTSTEKWKQLESDFPEWTAALNERLDAVSAELAGKVPKFDPDGIKRDVVEAMTPMMAAAKTEAIELMRIHFKHDGWEETVRTQEFVDWFTQQPQEIQALADSSKSADAIKLLDAYKASITPAPAQPDPADKQHKQQQRLEQAVTPKGNATPAPAALSDEDAFLVGFGGRAA